MERAHCNTMGHPIDRFNCFSDLCEKKCKLCRLCNDGKKYAERAPMADRMKCLEEHNRLRATLKDTPNLEWDDELAAYAQSYAEKLANTVDFRHSKVGENMYMKYGGDGSTSTSCISASDEWFKEINYYSYSNHGPINPDKETRHFQQMAWRSNIKVGFGIAVHAITKTIYVIGEYKTPPIAGQEEANIKTPK
ncbi:uncharacterized protein [Clytia hemisphaerica]